MTRKVSRSPGDHAPATLIDVAKVAGVSPITVSRALSRPALVRPKTLARVNAAVLETGYVKNMLAGALASRRSKLVALILPQIATSTFARTVQAVTDTLALAGYQVLLGLSGQETLREEVLVDTILSRRPDGLILTGTQHTENTRKRLQRARIPVVETWDLTPSPIDMLVGFSHEEVGRAIAANLLGLGYRRFAVLTAANMRAQRRNQALMAALAEAGIVAVPVETIPAPVRLETARQGAARLFERGGIDVIVCSSDTMALGVLNEAASRGIAVPGDVGVMGFGENHIAANTFPALSSVHVDGVAIGIQAARALLERIDGATPRVATAIDVGFELIQRDSTARRKPHGA
jgi:LacI family gluconate utilization system Gnt-I transcriptional repressor